MNSAPPTLSGVPQRTLADLDFGRVLAKVADATRTVLGRRLALVPRLWTSSEDVVRELGLTTELRSLIDAGEQPPFGGIGDVGPHIERGVMGSVLEAAELIEAADALRGMWLLRRFLSGRRERAPLLAERAEALPDLSELAADLHDTFDENGLVKDDASPELFELRQKKRGLHERIRRRVRELVGDWDESGHLQDSYYTIREDRYVLPVRSGEKGDVSGIIHGSSHTGRTLFIEPAELVPINNELKLCEQAVRLEEHRILAARTALLAEHAEPILAGLALTADLDVVFGRASVSAAMQAAPPRITGGATRVLRARNPHLLLRGLKVVPNDVVLGGETRMLVLTGPNAGGKTVTLNTLGLFALMVRAGMHLPAAPDSEMAIFEEILTVVGDQQDLQSDLSTFSGHIRRIQDVLAQAGRRSLVLIDEAIVGTEPTQGAALAAAVIEALADRGAVGIVTTHYERLKTLSLEDKRFQNAAVGVDPRTHEPNYVLNVGHPGSSSPIEMAARLGLDEAIVARAESLLGDRARSVDRILERLESERAALQAERVASEKARAEVQAEKARYVEARARLDREGERLVRAQREEALLEIEAARHDVASIVRELQRDRSPGAVHHRRQDLRRIEEGLQALLDAPPPGTEDLPPPLEASEVKVGATVFVPSLKKTGTVAELRGASAIVEIGSLRTTVSLQSLRRPPESRRPGGAAPRPIPPPNPVTEVPPRTADNTVDVRGYLLTDALAEVERSLDNALLNDREVLFVLHGHGTGKLKSGLRDKLRTSRYVSRQEPADASRGGDGVTVVWLR